MMGIRDTSFAKELAASIGVISCPEDGGSMFL